MQYGWFTERNRAAELVFLNLAIWLVHREKEGRRYSILKPTKDGWLTERKREMVYKEKEGRKDSILKPTRGGLFIKSPPETALLTNKS